MAYRTKESRNEADRRRRAVRREKPKGSLDKTFVSWVSIPLAQITEHEDGVYHLDIVLGPLVLPKTRYDSVSGQWHSIMKKMRHADKPRVKPAWYVQQLRPLIIEAIEAKFGVELNRFERQKPRELSDDDRHTLQSLYDEHVGSGTLTGVRLGELAAEHGIAEHVVALWIKEAFATD